MNLLIYVFILTLVLFSIFSYSFVDINLLYLKSLYTGLYLNQRHALTIVYSVLIFVLFGCFYFVTKNADRFKNHLKRIILFVVLATIFAYPAMLTFDIFNYMTTAKVVYYYQENPYVIYPIEFVGEPNLLFTRAINKLALYAPFWIILTAIPYFVGFGNFIFTLFSFKIFIAIFYLATVYLISRMDRRAAVIFALNPLVVIEMLVSSHNDIVVVFFALLAIYLLKSNKVLSIGAILASILIKFSTLFLLPVYLLAYLNKLKDEKLYTYAAISMFLIFSLSPLREELYPWYAIWFIAFTAFLYKNKFLQNLVLVFSLGLMLRYIPYMLTGNYFGSTPFIKISLTSIPIALYLAYSYVIQKIKFNH